MSVDERIESYREAVCEALGVAGWEINSDEELDGAMLILLRLASRKPEAAPISYAELMLSPDSPLASRKPEAAPSDTDREALIEELEQAPDVFSINEDEAWMGDPGDRPNLTPCLRIVDVADFMLSRTSQPVQVEVTEPEWEYGRVNGEYITIPPAGIPHTHRRIKAVPAGEWEVAPAALGGGDQ